MSFKFSDEDLQPGPDGRPQLNRAAGLRFKDWLLNKPLEKPLSCIAYQFLEKLLDKCFCGMAATCRSNGSLAGLMRASERSIQRWLPKLEGAGIILMVDDDTRHSGRRIILLDHPDAARIIAKLKANPSVRFERTRGIHTSDNSQVITTNCRDETGHSVVMDHDNLSPKSSSRNRKEEASKKTPLNPPRGGTPEESAPLQRQRTAPPSAPPADQPQPEPVKTEVGLPISRDLTPGQQQFMNSLEPGQRSAFEAMIPERQAQILEPFAAGFDAALAKTLRSDMKVRVEPVELPPTDPVELIWKLPGSPHEWAQLAAEDMARNFGGKKDHSLWGQFYNIAIGIQAGEIEAESVANAYRQAMKPEIKNRGGKFWSAFKGLTGLDENDIKAIGKGGQAS